MEILSKKGPMGEVPNPCAFSGALSCESSCVRFPEGPRIEKIQSRKAILKKSSFQYRMKFSIENEIFIPGLATQCLGAALRVVFAWHSGQKDDLLECRERP